MTVKEPYSVSAIGGRNTSLMPYGGDCALPQQSILFPEIFHEPDDIMFERYFCLGSAYHLASQMRGSCIKGKGIGPVGVCTDHNIYLPYKEGSLDHLENLILCMMRLG
jgi:hypothetical protein